MEYTNYMTGEEYNHLRESVDWHPITPGQAERGLQNTSFLVVEILEMKIISSSFLFSENSLKVLS